MTKIKIKDLLVFANHGVLKEENSLGQKFIVSIEIDAFTNMSDSIDNTINYAEVCEFVESEMQNNTYALIETAANKLAKSIMLNYPLSNAVRVEIKKPWAPIGKNLDYVSVEFESKWHTVYIALGANLGDRRGHLLSAVDKIRQNPICRVNKVSDFIETKPVGYKNQNDFLNGCMEIETLYEPFELLEFLHKIEDEDGRTHDIHWGPRTIDLDIIYYDDIIIYNEKLVIPHKEMCKRFFVLKPLSELAPDKRHPVSGKTAYEMIAEL